MHRGLQEEVVQQACDAYFAQAIAPNIFPEMHELVQRLRASGCDVWAVSSSSQWIIRSGMRSFGIPQNRILAAEVAVENGTITDRLIRVPSGPGKSEAIRSVLKSSPDHVPDCAFGNAIWDREMLAMSKHPFAINPNPDLKEIALAERLDGVSAGDKPRCSVVLNTCVILSRAGTSRSEVPAESKDPCTFSVIDDASENSPSSRGFR